MERSPCEACLQTILSGKRALILVCPPLPSPATPPLGLEGARPLAADPFPSRRALFPTEKRNHATEPRHPFRHKRAASIPSLGGGGRLSGKGKAGAGAQAHTSPLSLPGTSSPLCPLRENSNAKRWSQRPPELGRLREGGHASAQPGAGTRRSPRPPPVTAETPRRGRAAAPRPHAGPAARPPLSFFRSRRSSLFPIPFFSLRLCFCFSVCSFSSFSPRLCGFPLSRSGFEVFFSVLLFLFFSLSFLVDSHVRIQARGPQRLPENRCAFLTSILLRKRAEWPGGGTFL